ncbi:hypothetical protein [Baaleninema simplex]|uniref:hypothetical protein n=1 Tax=Baaleninema simplex TaxID=2862350 RepID=UPI0003484B03|nr:hypothetical protein [Baaleninema simplex]
MESCVGIYSIPIETTAGIARHYYLSENGDFKNSVGWGPAGVEWRGTVKLTEAERSRANEYGDRFGMYNICTNNCEMFAWYVKRGKRYSEQTQKSVVKSLGAAAISAIQPVHTVRSQKYKEIEKGIVDIFNNNLEEAHRQNWKAQQAETDEFWRRRDRDSK